jgi:hypothetical protein
MMQILNPIITTLLACIVALWIAAWLSPDFLDVLSRKAKARAYALRVYRAAKRVAQEQYRDAYDRTVQRSVVADGVDQVVKEV